MTEARITVQEFQASDHREWSIFLARSENGTLFHDLDFLAYHPDGRHAFSHLLFYEGARLVALLTGILVVTDEGQEFRSCPAASFGGFVFDRKVGISTASNVVDAFVEHGKQQGWRSAQIILPPAAYNGRVGQLTSFVLSRSGFTAVNRQVTFLLPLDPLKPNAFETLFRSTSASKVRVALRKGVTVDVGAGALLPDFLRLFEQTYLRHGTPPTHSADEIEWITQQLPGRVTFFVARINDDAVAALCVFKVSRSVATTFYTCVDYARRNENGVLVALAYATDQLAKEGLEWLDLGPSGDLRHLNDAVISFKEGTGPVYGLREHWRILF